MLSRIENTQQSLKWWLDDWLSSVSGYSNNYIVVDEQPADRTNPLDKTIVVLSCGTAHGAEEGELGGPLALEPVVFTLDVIGKTESWGKNIATLLKEKLESAEPFPVYDFAENPPNQTDLQRIDAAMMTKLNFSDPAPWQRHWYLVSATVTLEYNRTYLS